MSNEKWITWERPARKRLGTPTFLTRLESERDPAGFHNPRPATPEEIAVAKAIRLEREEAHQKHNEFTSRPEYKAATAIRDRIEHMTPDDNPLDRLTPAEWEALRIKIVG